MQNCETVTHHRFRDIGMVSKKLYDSNFIQNSTESIVI